VDSAADNAAVGRAALAKATARLIPFLFLLYIVAFLDRVNVGFAALQMNEDLGFSDATGGYFAGLLFLAALILIAGLLALAVSHERSLEEVEEVVAPTAGTPTST
jgi:hypothetical protein